MHHCRKYGLMVGCLLVLCHSLKAQDTLTSANVETQSYSLFTQAKWDELINFGHKALSKGFDYYYIRYRLGAAYYAKKKYRTAETEFEKAMAFNTTDEATEYLYYCYLYTGQYERARWISKSFSPDMANRIGTDKLHAISFITLEGGIGASDSSNKFNDEYYAAVGLGHYVNDRFSLFHSFSFFSQTAFRGDIQQAKYYLGSNIPLKNNWSVLIGIDPIYNNYTDIAQIPERIIIGPPPPRGLPPKTEVVIKDSTEATKDYFNFVGAFTLQKSAGNFDLMIGSAISALDSTTQYEYYAGVTYYPLGNSILSLGATGYMHTENYFRKEHYAIVPSISFTPAKMLTITISYLTNNGGNLVENTGYLVDGTSDPMVARFSLLANVTLSKSFSIYGVYQHQDLEEWHRQWPFTYDVFIIGLQYIPK